MGRMKEISIELDDISLQIERLKGKPSDKSEYRRLCRERRKLLERLPKKERKAWDTI